LNTEQTTSKTVRYIEETTATNAAAPALEGDRKPEATLAVGQVDEPVRKVAVFLPVSDEMLDDAPGLRGYLNQRLSLFVRITEEDQLLRGNGTDPNLRGILNRSGIQTHNRASDTNLDAIRKITTKARTSFVEPTFVVMHPNQAETIDLVKATGSGEYISDPYRGGAVTLWAKPVVVTNAIGAGTVLVGSSQAATIYRRGGLVVEALNSHRDGGRRRSVGDEQLDEHL